MLQDQHLQLLRDCSRDATAFERLKAFFEGTYTPPTSPNQPTSPTETHDAQLAALVRSSQDAILMHTLDGIINGWNRGAEKVYGYAADEMIGQSIKRIIQEDL